jgi:transcription initiation factor IIE alpha subunit
MNLNTGKLLESMLNAAKSVLKKKWRSAKPYAENEFRKLLEEAVHIGKLKAEGKVTEEEAVYLMSLQRNSARMVMLTLEGLGIIAVEESINAALAAVRDTINSALGGWKLL